jgi:hypothetical protein
VSKNPLKGLFWNRARFLLCIYGIGIIVGDIINQHYIAATVSFVFITLIALLIPADDPSTTQTR